MNRIRTHKKTHWMALLSRVCIHSVWVCILSPIPQRTLHSCHLEVWRLPKNTLYHYHFPLWHYSLLDHHFSWSWCTCEGEFWQDDVESISMDTNHLKCTWRLCLWGLFKSNAHTYGSKIQRDYWVKAKICDICLKGYLGKCAGVLNTLHYCFSANIFPMPKAWLCACSWRWGDRRECAAVMSTVT